MIKKEIISLFEAWVENNREDIIKKWIELCKIPSVKASAEEGAPFGKECMEALLKSAELFEKDGFNVKVNRDGGYALCSFGTKGKKIGFYSHSDVVPVSDDWIYTSPFEPVIVDGNLIARGAEDNKSGIMLTYCIFLFLKEQNIPLNSILELFIGSDEECGMEDLKAYLKNEAPCDVSFVPDADFPCSVGEKGIYHLMAESIKPFSEIISIEGGQAYNIVLDNVTATVFYSEKIFAELTEITSAKNNISFSKENNVIKINAKGSPKHASIPEGSVNATAVLSDFLLDCDFVCQNDKAILKCAKTLLSCYYGGGMGIHHEDPLFGKTTCVNGLCKTEKGKLQLSFDIRYGDTMNPESLENIVDNALKENSFLAIKKDNSPGFSIDKNSPLPEIFEKIYFEQTGDNLKSVRMAGGTYARKLKNAFSVGTHITPEYKRLKMPEGHGGMHQSDECINIDGFFEAAKVILSYVLACDEIDL